MLSFWLWVLGLWPFAVLCVSGRNEPILTDIKNISAIVAFNDDTRIVANTEERIMAKNIAGGKDGDWTILYKKKYGIKHFAIDEHYPDRRAVLFSGSGEVYFTMDKAITWKKIFDGSQFREMQFLTNPLDSGLMLIVTKDSEERTKNYVSHDAGKSFSELKIENSTCRFARQSKESELGEINTIFCIGDSDETKILYKIDDIGNPLTTVDELEGKRILDVGFYANYLVIVTLEDFHNIHSKKTVWTSTDGKGFHLALFPMELHNKVELSSAVSSGKRLIINLFDEDKKSIKRSFISDSRGIRFTPLTKKIYEATRLDFNGKYDGPIFGYSEDPFGSFFSADFGRTWEQCKLADNEDQDGYPCDIRDTKKCALYLDAIPESSLYSTPMEQTSGIIIRTGFVKDTTYNRKVTRGDKMTFISRDGGIRWNRAFEFAVSVVYGDYGNIIVAYESQKTSTDKLHYSLDHGYTWEIYHFDQPLKHMEVVSLTVDNSGVDFLVRTLSSNLLLSFGNIFNGIGCSDNDLEEWAPLDYECIGGSLYKTKRRLQNSECLYKDSKIERSLTVEPCKCTLKDYECAPEFTENDFGNCMLDYEFIKKTGRCKDKDSLYLHSKQLSLGNKCLEPIEIPADDYTCFKSMNSGHKIQVSSSKFSSEFQSYQYFDSLKDDSLILTSKELEIFISHDGGISIEKLDLGAPVVETVFNPYFGDDAYLFGLDNQLHITHNRGHSFSSTELPKSKQLLLPLTFHPKDESTFIYYGGKDCKSIDDPRCHSVAYITRDGGKSFEELLSDVISCEFVGPIYKSPVHEDMIICEVRNRTTKTNSLQVSTNFFKDKKEVFSNIVGFFNTGQYTIVAVVHGKDEIRSYVTVDGENYAECKFPANFKVEKQQAYTVVASQNGAVFFHITTESKSGNEYGSLFKSNSNGTSLVLLKDKVNRDKAGYVDYDTVDGLEGIVLINVVDDQPSKSFKNLKKLKTMISFNDGADWWYVQPPARDSTGKSYHCSSKDLKKCSLHLHGYTDRKDVRYSSTSSSAIGYLVAVGNVGRHLLPYEKCSTFVSDDGGITWKEVAKTPQRWEFGDRGSIIVLAADGKEANSITYSIDSGNTWNNFQFSEDPVTIDDIITVPQDSSMRFLLMTKATYVEGTQTVTFAISFADVFERQCHFDPATPKENDLAYFPVKHPGTKCLFGHQAEYLKKIRHDCFIGTAPLKDRYRVVKDCPCTRNDFECAYNFFRDKSGVCKLVKGLKPPDPKEVCDDDSDLIEYYETVAYRKIPMSTCQGGLQLDKQTKPRPCPGKEREFRRKYGAYDRIALFCWTILWIVFFALMYVVYVRGIRRNGGFSRFGEIRLGDDDLIEENRTDRVVNTIVRTGAFVFWGTINLAQLLRAESRGMFRGIRDRIVGRRAPSYSSLIHDHYLDEADNLLTGHDNDASNLAPFVDEVEFEVGDELSSQQELEDQVATENIDRYHDSDTDNEGGNSIDNSGNTGGLR
ncbi:HFR016Cp [Eremothecium sinecaudum]|uniref:HFR016Cp n=1 Tax=Eremothecium sinecaudum TaxID=45286 RepID=A0A109UZV4_9SACH|nr:HFR016Cp [Eremothecium sinecaudum]AMD21871.1 HFR016Cp [Eremothecium sinecaudum]